MSLVELGVRTASLYLESVQQLLHSQEALMLLKDVVKIVKSRMNQLSDTQKQNIRLQIDQIVPVLTEVLMVSEKKLKDKIFGVDDGHNFAGVYMYVLQITNLICGIFDWKELVVVKLSHAKTLSVFISTAKNLKEGVKGFCAIPMTIQMLNLCSKLGWEEQVVEKLIRNSTFVQDLCRCPHHSNEIVSFTLNLSADKVGAWQPFMDILRTQEDENEYIHRTFSEYAELDRHSDSEGFSNVNDYERVEEMLDNIFVAAEKMTVSTFFSMHIQTF